MKRLPTTPRSTLAPQNLGIQRKRERGREGGGRGHEHPITFKDGQNTKGLSLIKGVRAQP